MSNDTVNTECKLLVQSLQSAELQQLPVTVEKASNQNVTKKKSNHCAKQDKQDTYKLVRSVYGLKRDEIGRQTRGHLCVDRSDKKYAFRAQGKSER